MPSVITCLMTTAPITMPAIAPGSSPEAGVTVTSSLTREQT